MSAGRATFSVSKGFYIGLVGALLDLSHSIHFTRPIQAFRSLLGRITHNSCLLTDRPMLA